MTKGLCEVSDTMRLLAVEERDLGGLEHVAAVVALGGGDEEVGLDVAEDGEAERGPGRGGRTRRTAAPPRL